MWISNVFAWRGSPAAWSEDLQAVEGKKLRRLDGDPALVVLSKAEGETLTVAASAEHEAALPGPFADGDTPDGTSVGQPASAAAPVRQEPDAP